jgi:hypothetical protein
MSLFLMRWTRSRGMFESDVLLKEVRDAARRRSPFALCPATGALECVRVVRGVSGVAESECQVRVRIPEQRSLYRAVAAAYKTGAGVNVVAYGPKAHAMYDRGQFVVKEMGVKFMTLEKMWPSSLSAAKDTKKSKDVAQVQATPNVVQEPEKQPEKQPATQRAEIPVTRFYSRPTSTMTRPQLTLTNVRPQLTVANVKPQFTPQTIVRSIRTVHNGTEYRSRLEARFAQLLDALHVRFVYEPVRLNQTSGGTYTIDFFLPAQQLYVELKPKRPHIEEEAKCERMSRSGFRVVLLYGSSVAKMPFRSEMFRGRSHRDYVHHDALRGMAWVDGKKLAGDTVFVRGPGTSLLAAGLPTDAVYLDQVVTTDDTRWNHPIIQTAMRSLYV